MAVETENKTIEQAVIGSLFVWWKQLKGYIPQLKDEDFVHYKKLFLILKTAYSSDKPYDEVLLLTDAQSKGILGEATECAQSVSTVMAFPDYLNRLLEVSQKRRLHDYIFTMYQRGTVCLEELEKIIKKERNNNIRPDGQTAASRKISEYLKQLGKPEPRIYTGFPMMDKVLGGFRRGTVCHIGARPSTGKTSFAINIAQKQEDKKVLFFSLEMSAGMILDRYASNVAAIDYCHFTSQDLSERQINEVRVKLKLLQDKNNFFVVDDIYNIESIESSVLQFRPDLVIIDYIQKVTTLSRFGTMRERIEYISGELKKLAKTNNCTVICLSQLSRDGQNAPTMSNLRESGALEADGDYIILLHRPFVLDKKEDIDPETTEVLIDKNKFGETGIINMRFKGSYQRFLEIDERFNERLGDI